MIPESRIDKGFIYSELGLFSSALIRRQTLSHIDDNQLLWLYEKAISEELLHNYITCFKEIGVKSTRRLPHFIDHIVFAGYEAFLTDALCNALSCDKKMTVLVLPNSPYVDIERLSRNLPADSSVNSYISDPYEASGLTGPKTLVIVPFFQTYDGICWVYTYPRRYLGDDIRKRAFKCIGIKLLPDLGIQDGYDSLGELTLLEQLDVSYFNKVYEIQY